MQDKYKNVDWKVFLAISKNQIWHFVLWWPGKTLEWPVPYITSNCQNWLSEIVIKTNLAKFPVYKSILRVSKKI